MREVARNLRSLPLQGRMVGKNLLRKKSFVEVRLLELSNHIKSIKMETKDVEVLVVEELDKAMYGQMSETFGLKGGGRSGVLNDERAKKVSTYHIIFPSPMMVTIYRTLQVPHYHANFEELGSLLSKSADCKVVYYTPTHNALPSNVTFPDHAFVGVWRDSLSGFDGDSVVKRTLRDAAWLKSLTNKAGCHTTSDEHRGQFCAVDYGYTSNNCPTREDRLLGLTGPRRHKGMDDGAVNAALTDLLLAMSEIYANLSSKRMIKERYVNISCDEDSLPVKVFSHVSCVVG